MIDRFPFQFFKVKQLVVSQAALRAVGSLVQKAPYTGFLHFAKPKKVNLKFELF